MESSASTKITKIVFPEGADVLFSFPKYDYIYEEDKRMIAVWGSKKLDYWWILTNFFTKEDYSAYQSRIDSLMNAYYVLIGIISSALISFVFLKFDTRKRLIPIISKFSFYPFVFAIMVFVFISIFYKLPLYFQLKFYLELILWSFIIIGVYYFIIYILLNLKIKSEEKN